MLFRLRTEMVFDRTIECDSRQEAIEYAKRLADEANKHNHHGEVTTVHVLSFAEHLSECDQCGVTQEPCALGKAMIIAEDLVS